MGLGARVLVGHGDLGIELGLGIILFFNNFCVIWVMRPAFVAVRQFLR